MKTIENSCVLVAVSEYGEFSALLSLCREIVPKLDLHPVFVFAPGYGLVKDHGQLVALENWSWVQLGSRNQSFHTSLDARSESGYRRVFDAATLNNKLSAGSSNDVESNNNRPGKFTLQLMMPILGARYLALRIMRRLTNKNGSESDSALTGRSMPIQHVKKELNHARRIFQKTNPKLILSGQDYALSVTSILAKVGEEQGIKTAIVPYSMPPTTREIIESFAYSDYNRLSGIDLKIASALNPKWINHRRGKDYSRVNVLYAMASDILGLTPPEPWLPNSGRGIVFAPSQQGYDYYFNAGIPATHLRMTGAPWNDRFIQQGATVPERKAKLLRRIRSLLMSLDKERSFIYESLKDNSRLVIISWPPNQWPRKALGCASYADLCRQFISGMSQIQNLGLANVAVSLHPTLLDEELIENLNRAGLHILTSDLIQYIDCADVFLSTVSSTSFWALQCGIPTINFDGYLYGYTEFEQAGAITVKTPQAAYEITEKLVENADYYADIKKQIATKATYFTQADGHSMERIMNELAALTPASAYGTNQLKTK